AVDVVDLRLGQEAEVARHGKRNVGKSHRQFGTLARQLAAAGGGRDADGGVETAGDVPCRQDSVAGVGVPGGPGHHGKPDLGIHRVVDGGSTIATPAHLDVHQVGRVLAQGVVRQPFLTDCVGEHDGCSGRTGPHQVTYDNPAFGTAQVELEGLL